MAVNRGQAQLLGGFAGYKSAEPDDLAALLWMRQRVQLLLELAVSCPLGIVFTTRCAM